MYIGWPMDRYSQTLARRAEGADLRANRWHRRRSDDLIAGAARRRAQLGLPVLLAARCHLYPARAAACRVLRRGADVARLAISRGRRKPRSAADHVWSRRRAAAYRMGGFVAAWIRRVATGPHRQRRGKPDATRHLRRGPRRSVPC